MRTIILHNVIRRVIHVMYIFCIVFPFILTVLRHNHFLN